MREYVALNALLRILGLNPHNPINSPYRNDLVGFKRHINKLLFDFFEECRTNLEYGNQESKFLLINDLIDKFIHIKNQNFKIENNTIIHYPSRIELKAEKDTNVLTVLKSQLECFDTAISHLNELSSRYDNSIEEPNQPQKREHKKSRPLKYPSFRSNLTAENLQDIYRYMLKEGFIHKSTDLKAFIGAFSGENPKKKINWTATQQELRWFIKGINKISIKNISGEIWKVTSNCFINSDGEEFDPVMIKNAGKPKSTERVEKLITTFNYLTEID